MSRIQHMSRAQNTETHEHSPTESLPFDTNALDVSWFPTERRKDAAELVQKLGVRKDEGWKYTPLSPALQAEYTDAQVSFSWVSDEEFLTLKVVYSDSNTPLESSSHPSMESTPLPLPAGLNCAVFSKVDQPPVGTLATEAQHVLGALNTARCPDGIMIELAEKTALNQTLVIEHERHTAQPLISYPRVFIHCHPHSQLKVIERFHSAGAPSLTNAVTELDINDGARCQYTRVQIEESSQLHVARVVAKVHAQSALQLFNLNTGAKLARIELEVHLADDEANADLAGLYIGSGQQLLDQHLTIHHLAPRCHSSQRFKGVLGGQSRGIFTGKVHVAPGASSTLAEQNNPSLLLSPQARAISRPQLEIYNDEVECSHGATIGSLDEDARFYLRARGLSDDQALSMLTEAFVDELRDSFNDARGQLAVSQALEKALAGENKERMKGTRGFVEDEV